jgi:hypothetical protein
VDCERLESVACLLSHALAIVADALACRLPRPAGMNEQERRPPGRLDDEDDERTIDGGAYAAPSSESGGDYDDAGPTIANIKGEPADADEEIDSEPSPS